MIITILHTSEAYYKIQLLEDVNVYMRLKPKRHNPYIGRVEFIK